MSHSKNECKMKTLKFLITVVVIALLFGGCKYDFIVEEEIPVIDPGDPNAEQISFSTAILPIFTTGNNCTSCHSTGKTAPDLTAANAYSAIVSKYINTTTPEQSTIYTVPKPDVSGHSQKKYTANQAALILIWIQQGAKNN
jgi:hypothetical protein